MPDWTNYIDKAIREAMAAGEFDNLPGEGKPFVWQEGDDDENWLAHKLLKDNALAPDWIMQGKELDAKLVALARQARQALRAYEAAQASPDIMARISGEGAWKQAQQTLTAATAKLNSEIVTWNLKAPAGIQHRPLIQLYQLIERLRNPALPG
jgi:hypothetical protein